MRAVIDSYAWIEYLDGTSKGAKVRDILMQGNEIYTLALNVAEVISRVKRKEEDTDLAYRAMALNSKILSINQETAKQAGLLYAEIRKKIKNFGLIDSLILLIARKLNAKIITGDKHFKDFKEAVLIS